MRFLWVHEKVIPCKITIFLLLLNKKKNWTYLTREIKLYSSLKISSSFADPVQIKLYCENASRLFLTRFCLLFYCGGALRDFDSVLQIDFVRILVQSSDKRTVARSPSFLINSLFLWELHCSTSWIGFFHSQRSQSWKLSFTGTVRSFYFGIFLSSNCLLLAVVLDKFTFLVGASLFNELDWFFHRGLNLKKKTLVYWDCQKFFTLGFLSCLFEKRFFLTFCFEWL